MTIKETAGDDADKHAIRRRQVLEAAAACFRQHGFHGASMAQISRVAGMSVGHIYHYFDNKEAIISAIVQEHLESMLAVVDTIENSGPDGDILTRFIAGAEVGACDCYNTEFASLMLEITAEGGRNPAVAAMLQHADAVSRERFKKMLRQGVAGRVEVSEAELDQMVLSIKCLFEGLFFRSVRQPTLAPADVSTTMKRALQCLLPPI